MVNGHWPFVTPTENGRWPILIPIKNGQWYLDRNHNLNIKFRMYLLTEYIRNIFILNVLNLFSAWPYCHLELN